jgi:hypothetical protein
MRPPLINNRSQSPSPTHGIRPAGTGSAPAGTGLPRWESVALEGQVNCFVQKSCKSLALELFFSPSHPEPQQPTN